VFAQPPPVHRLGRTVAPSSFARITAKLADARGLESLEGAEALVVFGAPVPPGATAITLGDVVFIREEWRRSKGLAELIRHEMVHVRQWRERGVLGFLQWYLGSYLGWRVRGYSHWAAYRRIPAEVEAAWEARRRRPASPAQP
jgi:hypothetical protein